MRRQHTMNRVRNRARRRAGAAAAAALIATGLVPAGAHASTSGLDPAFGGTGSVLTDFTGGEDGAAAVAVTPAGEIIATGFGDLGDPSRPHVAGFGFARYLPGGSPDPAFSGDGRTLADFGFVNQGATTVGVDSAGRVIATGTITTFDGSTSSIGIARLLPDGTPDPSFGGGDGEVVIQPGTLSLSYDAAIASGDGIVVLGAATGEGGFRPTVMRFREDGTLDPAFGDGGIARFGKPFSDDYRALALDGRDRALLAGTSAGRSSVVRLSAAGKRDADYGDGGSVAPFGRNDAEVADLALDESGRATVAATCACRTRGDDDMAVARLTRRGRLDAGFGRGGRAYATFGRKDAAASSAAVDPHGRIVLGGSIRAGDRREWALARFTAGGRRDRKFGDGGSLTADIGPGVEGVRDVAVDSASRVLAVGLGSGPDGSDFAVARFR